MKALSGNAEDKSTFQYIIKSLLDSLKAAENSQYLIADLALYTKATIQSLHEKNRYFITRISSVSNDAKAVSNRPDLAAFMPICDGYEGYYTDSNYADVPQKWLVIRSQAGRERALKTFDKDVAKGKVREEKQLSSLMKKNFSCEHDALSRLEEFKRELKYTEIKDY